MNGNFELCVSIIGSRRFQPPRTEKYHRRSQSEPAAMGSFLALSTILELDDEEMDGPIMRSPSGVAHSAPMSARPWIVTSHDEYKVPGESRACRSTPRGQRSTFATIQPSFH
eukprot:GABV01008463.1.p1 GENE.GABV01008463.1~~GABV01008463.1.p1  ORF type:complete len:112 (-),score=25.53 GABV01008463.1:11-346(-)